MMPFMDPPVVRHLSADRGSRRHDGGRGHAPVVAVLVACAGEKPDERMAAPKGRESWTPGSSSLQIGRFLGVRHGGP